MVLLRIGRVYGGFRRWAGIRKGSFRSDADGQV